MADYDSSLPVRTENDGDVIVKIGDESTPSQQVEVKATKEMMVALRDPSSTNELVINADGSINSNIVTTQVGDDIHEFDDSVGVAPNTPTTVLTYTVSGGKTLALKLVGFSASGKAKLILQTGPAGYEVTKAVAFISTAQGTVELTFPQPIEVVAGDNVLMIITNRDNQNQDLYAWINGTEV
jgi:hypothetical protein